MTAAIRGRWCPAGDTFKASNDGVGAGFAPGRLYMQNHGGWADWTGPGGPRPDIGVLRSDDHGRSWRSIAKGLPSDFGFPIVVHPHDADTVYVVPLEPSTRSCPGGAPALYFGTTTGQLWIGREGGEKWDCLFDSLPPIHNVKVAVV